MIEKVGVTASFIQLGHKEVESIDIFACSCFITSSNTLFAQYLMNYNTFLHVLYLI